MMSDNVDPRVKELELQVSVLEDVIKNICFKDRKGKVYNSWNQDVDLREKAPHLYQFFKE